MNGIGGDVGNLLKERNEGRKKRIRKKRGKGGKIGIIEIIINIRILIVERKEELVMSEFREKVIMEKEVEKIKGLIIVIGIMENDEGIGKEISKEWKGGERRNRGEEIFEIGRLLIDMVGKERRGYNNEKIEMIEEVMKIIKRIGGKEGMS